MVKFEEELIMIIGIWDEDIKRLIELKENDELNESDVEEVADYYNETMKEVYANLIIESIDLTQDVNCIHCNKVISLEESSAFNGICEECDNKGLIDAISFDD
jgi:Zn finger protein HypA/HybF involved in hydrogenase expression